MRPCGCECTREQRDGKHAGLVIGRDAALRRPVGAAKKMAGGALVLQPVRRKPMKTLAAVATVLWAVSMV
jgi:hypothetical protein